MTTSYSCPTDILIDLNSSNGGGGMEEVPKELTNKAEFDDTYGLFNKKEGTCRNSASAPPYDGISQDGGGFIPSNANLFQLHDTPLIPGPGGGQGVNHPLNDSPFGFGFGDSSHQRMSKRKSGSGNPLTKVKEGDRSKNPFPPIPPHIVPKDPFSPMKMEEISVPQDPFSPLKFRTECPSDLEIPQTTSHILNTSFTLESHEDPLAISQKPQDPFTPLKVGTDSPCPPESELNIPQTTEVINKSLVLEMHEDPVSIAPNTKDISISSSVDSSLIDVANLSTFSISDSDSVFQELEDKLKIGDEKKNKINIKESPINSEEIQRLMEGAKQTSEARRRYSVNAKLRRLSALLQGCSPSRDTETNPEPVVEETNEVHAARANGTNTVTSWITPRPRTSTITISTMTSPTLKKGKKQSQEKEEDLTSVNRRLSFGSSTSESSISPNKSFTTSQSFVVKKSNANTERPVASIRPVSASQPLKVTVKPATLTLNNGTVKKRSPTPVLPSGGKYSVPVTRKFVSPGSARCPSTPSRRNSINHIVTPGRNTRQKRLSEVKSSGYGIPTPRKTSTSTITAPSPSLVAKVNRPSTAPSPSRSVNSGLPAPSKPTYGEQQRSGTATGLLNSSTTSSQGTSIASRNKENRPKIMPSALPPTRFGFAYKKK